MGGGLHCSRLTFSVAERQREEDHSTDTFLVHWGSAGTLAAHLTEQRTIPSSCFACLNGTVLSPEVEDFMTCFVYLSNGSFSEVATAGGQRMLS